MKKGFTLIELLIVLVILSILVGFHSKNQVDTEEINSVTKIDQKTK